MTEDTTNGDARQRTKTLGQQRVVVGVDARELELAGTVTLVLRDGRVVGSGAHACPKTTS